MWFDKNRDRATSVAKCSFRDADRRTVSTAPISDINFQMNFGADGRARYLSALRLMLLRIPSLPSQTGSRSSPPVQILAPPTCQLPVPRPTDDLYEGDDSASGSFRWQRAHTPQPIVELAGFASFHRVPDTRAIMLPVRAAPTSGRSRQANSGPSRTAGCGGYGPSRPMAVSRSQRRGNSFIDLCLEGGLTVEKTIDSAASISRISFVNHKARMYLGSRGFQNLVT